MKQESLFKPPVTRRTKAGRVSLNPGEDVGEHVTDAREEVIIVLKGTATVSVGGGGKCKEHSVGQGQAFYISEGKRHNVRNDTGTELEYVYVVSLLE
jgi:mannose-6-phosphate isomerase-like protein (cupin superfamily)